MRRLKFIPENPNHFLMILLGLWFILNIIQGIFTELADIEAYHWAVSGELLWGYFDHPPLSGLLIWLGVNSVGDSEIGIRLFNILLQPLYLYLFWTVVRSQRSTWESAFIYFIVAFSIPQLQFYGWIATPEAALLMAMAFLLWSYNRYIQKKDILSVLMMGIGFALLIYAKYQGAIVLLLFIIAIWRRLKQWQIWSALIIAALLTIPHLLWQYQHSWVSFRYHIFDLNNTFAWGDMFVFLFILFVTFNLFIVIPFVLYLVKHRPENEMEQTLRILVYGFVTICIVAILFGYVYPQWVAPVALSILYIITRSAEKFPAVKKYILRLGSGATLFFMTIRVVLMCYSGDLVQIEVFNNRQIYGALADKMQNRTLIFDNHYTQAAKMKYYSNGDAIAYPSIYRGSSHFQLMEKLDDHLYGRPVAIVVTDSIRSKMSSAELNSRYTYYDIENSIDFYYDTIDFYIPTRDVTIEYDGLPINTLTERPIVLKLDIYNPYQYAIPLKEFRLIGHFRLNQFMVKDVDIPLSKTTMLPANSHSYEKVEFYIPRISSGRYKFGLTLQRHPGTSWYNSERSKIQITNPAERRGI